MWLGQKKGRIKLEAVPLLKFHLIGFTLMAEKKESKNDKVSCPEDEVFHLNVVPIYGLCGRLTDLFLVRQSNLYNSEIGRCTCLTQPNLSM